MATSTQRTDLSRYAYLAIGAAVATIALKTWAWSATGSVGLLSDAAESVVNLVAAVVALVALRVSAMPPDDDHNYGHSKAEYFSAAIEGVMIFIAAVVIIGSAVERFVSPQPIENVGLGLVVSAAASVINGLVGWVLIRAGRRHRSITLTADGKHLWTDVVTSVGVIVGIVAVAITGWTRLDPIIAFAVGINIIVTGWRLVVQSAGGLMDRTLPDDDNAVIVSVLRGFVTDEVMFHGLRSRVSGPHRFASFDVLVPGSWTVARGHDLVENVEAAVRDALPDIDLAVHLEPREDPRAYDDHPVEIPIPTTPASPAGWRDGE